MATSVYCAYIYIYIEHWYVGNVYGRALLFCYCTMSCAQAINILGSFVHIAFAFRCFPSNWLAHRAQTTCLVWWLSHGRLKTNNTRQRKASSRQLSEQAQALPVPPVPVINEHKAKWQTWLELMLAFAWHGRVGLARHRWVAEKCNKYWNRTYESRQRKDNGRPEWNRIKANRKPIYQLEISFDSKTERGLENGEMGK